MPWNSQPVHIVVPTTKTTNAAMVADHINRQPSTTAVEDDTHHRVVAVKRDTLAPHTQTPVSVKSNGLERRALEPIEDNANLAPLHVARGKVDVTSNMLFYI